MSEPKTFRSMLMSSLPTVHPVSGALAAMAGGPFPAGAAPNAIAIAATIE